MSENVHDAPASIWFAGVDAVRGDSAVAAALSAGNSFAPDYVVGVGKAATSMCAGAYRHLGAGPTGLAITATGYAGDELAGLPDIDVIESSHPIPDDRSIDAGRRLRDCVSAMDRESRLLLLVSGGASALVELPEDGTTLKKLRELNERWISSGLSIDAINAQRRKLSQIKGGRLLQRFRGTSVLIYAISDVEGDDIAVIGSGIGDPALARCANEVKIVASNRHARQAAATYAAENGYVVRLNEESLYGDVTEIAGRLVDTLTSGAPGVYIWGGEPVVTLPERPGKGGRNQFLALLIASKIVGRDIRLIAAGTDGLDGASSVAGAVVHGKTVDDDFAVKDSLLRADSGTWLDERGATFVSGATGTNVMDLVVAIVGNGGRA
ncbi:MAG: DUF4147 domain-containing protein [Gammaproteobacteria bacterium]|nr:DUF4147 domain-containing protein [Gammaproteobacteria bacterium]